MKKIIYSVAFALLAILNACTKEIITIDDDSDVPVVEAFLEPGKEVSVKLSKMLPFSEDEYTGSLTIDTAEVYINYNGTDYLLTPVSDEPGKYVSLDSALTATAGGSYNLYFSYNGYTITSTTSIPSQPVNVGLSSTTLRIDPTVMGPGSIQDPMTITWENPDNTYYLIVVEYLESTYDPINENMNLENFDQFQKVSTDPVSVNSYNLDTRQHLVFFGSYKVIIYKVNEEYVNLYENVSQSSLNLTEPLTNIENGLGIFTGINSDTLFLEVKEI